MSAALLVADSDPLIALARLDLLNFPTRYLDSVLATNAVWDEATRKPRADEGPCLVSAVSRKIIEVVPGADNIPVSMMRQTIDTGERSAIALGVACSESRPDAKYRRKRVPLSEKGFGQRARRMDGDATERLAVTGAEMRTITGYERLALQSHCRVEYRTIFVR
jgi:hypothetical protein